MPKRPRPIKPKRGWLVRDRRTSKRRAGIIDLITGDVALVRWGDGKNEKIPLADLDAIPPWEDVRW